MKIDFDHIKHCQALIKQVLEAGATDAIVAGGAVRDMLLGREIKDIDIFYTGNLSLDFADKQGIKAAPNQKDYDGIGEDGAQFSVENWTGVDSDYPVQLIRCSDVNKSVCGFGVNLSKVCLDIGGLSISKEFLHDAELEILTFTEETLGTKYEERIRAKYPTFL